MALCIALLAVLLSGCTQPATQTPTPINNTTPSTEISFVDTNGNTITLPQTASRIIVTNSDSAEVLIAIGAKDRIVGVSDTVKKNPALAPLLENVTSIGSWDSPNMEQIAQLQPDAVIVYASWKPKNADMFQNLNVTILPLDCGNMKTVVSDIRSVGKLTGNEAKAEEYAKFVQDNIDLVTTRTANLTDAQKPKAYWEYNSQYSTGISGSGADTLITYAGGKNIAHDVPGNASSVYKTVTNEFVMENNPDVIIKTYGYGVSAQNVTNLRNDTMSRIGLADVNATKDGKVYAMCSFITYGPKGSIGLLYLAKIQQPELFADVDPARSLAEYDQKYVQGTDIPNLIYPVPA